MFLGESFDIEEVGDDKFNFQLDGYQETLWMVDQILFENVFYKLIISFFYSRIELTFEFRKVLFFDALVDISIY